MSLIDWYRKCRFIVSSFHVENVHCHLFVYDPCRLTCTDYQNGNSMTKHERQVSRANLSSFKVKRYTNYLARQTLLFTDLSLKKNVPRNRGTIVCTAISRIGSTDLHIFFRKANSGWEIVLGGQLMTWGKCMKTLIGRLSRIVTIKLLELDFLDPPRQRLVTTGDMVSVVVNGFRAFETFLP